MSSSILERKWEVLARNVLFLGDSSTLGWKMTSVGEKAGLLGKKMPSFEKSAGISGGLWHIFGSQLVYPGEDAIFTGASVTLSSVK